MHGAVCILNHIKSRAATGIAIFGIQNRHPAYRCQIQGPIDKQPIFTLTPFDS